jgi:hypothetical protein
MTRTGPDVELQRVARRRACVGSAKLEDGQLIKVMITDQSWMNVFPTSTVSCDDLDALWACWEAAKAPQGICEEVDGYRVVDSRFIETAIRLGY